MTRKAKTPRAPQSPDRKRKSRAAATEDACPHCRTGEESYGYLRRAYVYDVDAARRITSDGRLPVELDADDVAYLVDNSRIYDQHVDHVDPSFPGIIAHLWGPGSDGACEHGHLLIDGNHRAARCLRDGLTFRAYVLTEVESEQILRRGPGRSEVLTHCAPRAGSAAD